MMGKSLGRNRVVTIQIPQQQQPCAAGDVVEGIVKIDFEGLQQLGKLTENLMLHLVGTEQQTCCQYHNDQNTTSVYGKEVLLQDMPLKPQRDAKQQELTFSIRIPDKLKSSFYFQPKNPKSRPSCSLKVSTAGTIGIVNILLMRSLFVCREPNHCCPVHHLKVQLPSSRLGGKDLTVDTQLILVQQLTALMVKEEGRSSENRTQNWAGPTWLEGTL
jgi:hypothetical protein